MAIMLGNWWGRIKGGWKTVGAPGVGAFAANTGDWSPGAVDAQTALKLSAYYACLRLISETMGSLSFRVLDNKDNVVEDHDLYELIRVEPNQHQTGDMFVSAMAANSNMHGNGMAHIGRYSTGKAYKLDFYAYELWDVGLDEQGRPQFKLNGDRVPTEDVLHWPNFGTNGYWGIPSLVAGAEAMAAQVESNRAAARTFASGLRAGGFFTLPENKQAFTTEQLLKLKQELAKFKRPENTADWFTLLPGMTPVANTSFRIDPVTAELLQSRYFGVEEVCRFMGVPPPLIGHTDKASSWASSVENLNQFLVTYTLLPRTVRFEAQIQRRLLGRNERRRLRPNFNMDSLLRADIEKRFKTYDIALKHGMYSKNDARSKENMPPVEGGDSYDGTGKPANDEGKKNDPASDEN